MVDEIERERRNCPFDEGGFAFETARTRASTFSAISFSSKESLPTLLLIIPFLSTLNSKLIRMVLLIIV